MIDANSIVLYIDLAVWTVGSLISIFMALETLQVLRLAKVSRSLCALIIWLIILSASATIVFTVFYLVNVRFSALFALIILSLADSIQVTA